MLPTLDIAVRVEFMARHIPSQVGNAISEDDETRFVRLLNVSIAVKTKESKGPV